MAEVLKVNKTLERLYLRGKLESFEISINHNVFCTDTNIGDCGVIDLAAGLKVNNTLTALSLAGKLCVFFSFVVRLLLLFYIDKQKLIFHKH